MAVKDTCTVCGGSGEVTRRGGKTETCPMCKGKGWVIIPQKDRDPKPGEWE